MSQPPIESVLALPLKEIIETHIIVHNVTCRLGCEASKHDPDLRRLVLHANLLDYLRFRILKDGRPAPRAEAFQVVPDTIGGSCQSGST